MGDTKGYKDRYLKGRVHGEYVKQLCDLQRIGSDQGEGLEESSDENGRGQSSENILNENARSENILGERNGEGNHLNKSGEKKDRIKEKDRITDTRDTEDHRRNDRNEEGQINNKEIQNKTDNSDIRHAAAGSPDINNVEADSKKEALSWFEGIEQHEVIMDGDPDEDTNISQPSDSNAEIRKDAGNQKEFFLDIILDGTYSFCKVFPKVYLILGKLMEMFQDQKKIHNGMFLKYGLTVLHHKAEQIKFKNKECFTVSELEFLQNVKRVKFQGGSRSGKENLEEALEVSLDKLNISGNSNTCRGLLLLSDSLPEEDMEPDFSKDRHNIGNRGLQFAHIYTYQDIFMPQFKMVDRNGEIIENGQNEAYYSSLSELLSLYGWDLLEYIQGIVEEIFWGTSEMFS